MLSGGHWMPMFRFSGRVRSSAFPVGEHSALRAGIFKASGSTDPMGVLRTGGLRDSAHRLDEPHQVNPSARVASLQGPHPSRLYWLQREAKWLEGENNYTAPKDFP